MCGIAVSMALSFGIWTYLHRKTRIVRASQPFFLYLLIFGVLLYVLSIVPLTKFHTVEEEAYIKPLSEQRHQADHDDEYGKSRGDTDCTVVVWLASLGFSIAYSGALCIYEKREIVCALSDEERNCVIYKPTYPLSLYPHDPNSFFLSLSLALFAKTYRCVEYTKRVFICAIRRREK